MSAGRNSSSGQHGVLAPLAVGALALLGYAPSPLRAQAPAAAKPAPTPRAQAPIDPTGYWVSLITQNWQYRMVVPGRGEYADIPLNDKAKKFADAWSAAADTAAGKACEAYGAAVLMRNPERLHILWQDEQTLRVDTDAGRQTRLLHFGTPASQQSASLQGYSSARWQIDRVVNTFGAPVGRDGSSHYGSLIVHTDHLLPGLLRKNGVPYGADTTVGEIWDLRILSASDQWLTISTKVEDPQYLFQPYVYDSIFQKEPDGSKWSPGACSLTTGL
ncbi:MAG TPA: hypothetical protein VMF64_16885 [Steroidobacteraceae bacterium]|nr:hypothetical protein [Steroidobacteraceae bacterium]